MGARKYSGQGADTNTASTTIVELRSATTIRPNIVHAIVSSVATPADNAGEYALRRTTTAGTPGSSFTPVALDPGDPASLATFSVAHSAEPTYTANSDLLHFCTNQRATYTFMAYPGMEIVLPAAANGAGLLAVAIGGSAVNTHCQMFWTE